MDCTPCLGGRKTNTILKLKFRYVFGKLFKLQLSRSASRDAPCSGEDQGYPLQDSRSLPEDRRTGMINS